MDIKNKEFEYKIYKKYLDVFLTVVEKLYQDQILKETGIRARKIYFIFKELYDCDNSINFKLKESNYQQNGSTTKLYLNARFFRFAKKSIDIFINTIYKIVQKFVVFIASLAVRLSECLKHI